VLRFEFGIEVDRPPSEVFVLITDASRLPEWQSDVVDAEWQAEPEQGTRIREVRRFPGRRFEIEQEVMDYESVRRFGLRAVSGPFPLSVMVVLEPRNDGSTLRLNGEAEPGGFFMLAECFVARVAERQARTDFETMKGILEGKARKS
jgi:uncharacterized protein YndB with AHSA1/START domain